MSLEVATCPHGQLARQCELCERDAEIARLRHELETERMRLAACGVVAMADTPESAAKARNMHPDYRSASCDDVARRVDECIALRARLAAAQADNAALRDTLKYIRDNVPCVPGLRRELSGHAIMRATSALATPAPGAPLLDAVRGLVEAVESYRDQIAECGGRVDEWAMFRALAAVRAVLSPPQDTAGRSRGGGG